MNRRNFLTVSTAAALNGVCVCGASGAGFLASRRPLLRGTGDGKILHSLDGGRTWEVNTDLGSHLSIVEISQNTGRARAVVKYRQHTFVLETRDYRNWLTHGRHWKETHDG